MAVFDTTNVAQSAMFLKAKTPKNAVMDNEYIYDLQQRRNEDWLYRSNVVDIEEELQKPLDYNPRYPDWSWTEAVIDTAHSDTGIKLSDDWRILKFKDINHLRDRGFRYRFSYDFEQYSKLPPSDRHETGSVWIAVNTNTAAVSGDIVIRRCQTNVAFGGVRSILASSADEAAYSEIVETHYEPAIIEDQMTSNFKAINKYSNEVISLPQAELYVVMQANYYTRFIGINDRLIIGNTFGTNSSELVRNFTGVFEVKAVRMASADRTYATNSTMDVSHFPLIYIALDKALEAPGDDMYTRLAEHCPLYIVPSDPVIPTSSYALSFGTYKKILLFTEAQTLTCKLYNDGEEVTGVDYSSCVFTITGPTGCYSSSVNINSATITNLKKSATPVTVVANYTYNGVAYTTPEASIVLGGFS